MLHRGFYHSRYYLRALNSLTGRVAARDKCGECVVTHQGCEPVSRWLVYSDLREGNVAKQMCRFMRS